MKNPAFVGGCTALACGCSLINLLGVTGDVAGMGMVASLLAGAVCAKALQRSLLGASSGFWHSVPGRWLIGRVAGLAVILLLVFPVFYGVRLAAGLLLLLLYDLGGVTVVTAALKPVGVGALSCHGGSRLAAAHARESDHRQEHAQAEAMVSQLHLGPGRFGRFRVDPGGMGQPVAAGDDLPRA